jgi:hypothetical protein
MIPTKPLVIIDYDVDELTLDESRTLFADTYVVEEFRQFLCDHVDHEHSWTVAEIGRIKRKELGDVRRQVNEALIDVTVKRPLPAPPPDTGTGRAETPASPS